MRCQLDHKNLYCLKSFLAKCLFQSFNSNFQQFTFSDPNPTSISKLFTFVKVSSSLVLKRAHGQCLEDNFRYVKISSSSWSYSEKRKNLLPFGSLGWKREKKILLTLLCLASESFSSFCSLGVTVSVIRADGIVFISMNLCTTHRHILSSKDHFLISHYKMREKCRCV